MGKEVDWVKHKEFVSSSNKNCETLAVYVIFYHQQNSFLHKRNSVKLLILPCTFRDTNSKLRQV